MKKFQIGAAQVRNGWKARVYALDCGGEYSIHGAYLQPDGQWISCAWKSNGSYFTNEGDIDLLPNAADVVVSDAALDAYYRERGWKIPVGHPRNANDREVSRGLAAAFATEAGKLHQYLIGQRLIGRNDPLPVVVLAHPQAMAAIRQTCIDGNGLVFQITDNHQAAARIGLQTFPENSRSDWLYLHLLATSPPPQQFLGDEGRHAYQIDRIKGGLLRFGFLALLAALLFASHEQYQAYSLHQDAASLTTQATQADQRYQSIAATYPQLGIDHDTLRQVTDRYIALQRNQHLPDALFKEISQALDNSPAIDIDSIEWKQIAPANGQPGNATPAADSLPRYTGEKALIRGTVRASNAASPREILATLEAFAQQLRSRPGLRVEVQQQPFDVASGRALKGGDLDSVAATHPFALQVSREFQP